MKTIIVAESNELMRKNIVEILEMAGHIVETASNEMKLDGMITALTPDLVICDPMIRKIDALQSTRLILLTSRPGLSCLSDDQAGFCNYLAKPFSADQLLQAVEKAFEAAE